MEKISVSILRELRRSAYRQALNDLRDSLVDQYGLDGGKLTVYIVNRSISKLEKNTSKALEEIT